MINSRESWMDPLPKNHEQQPVKIGGHGPRRRTTVGPCPLSFAQQRLWFLDQLEPDSPLYNIAKTIRMDGPLNVEALQKTLDTIVARHEVLRTTFPAVDGVPVQVIAESRSAGLKVIDLSQWPAAEREGEVQRLLREEANRPFNLSCDLMLRATLVKLEWEDHLLLLVMHHIASDGWSSSVLSQELTALYRAFSTDRPSPLAELPIQYADYAVWQRQWLEGEVLEAQLSYWKKQLDGIPTLRLPTDRPRPAVQTFRGARQSLMLPKPLTEALKKLSQRERVTLFMMLLAAFQTLLHRYAGQDDIVVGSPIAGRSWLETEGLIGFLVNSLVMRADLSGDPTFRELLARVRTMALDAYAHQDLPFERLVEELQPERDLSHNPLFQVMFAFQNVPRQTLELPGLRESPIKLSNGTAKFDLTFSMIEEADLLRGSVEYSTDLFEDATISRMVGHLQTLLEGIVAAPEQRLSDLPLLSKAERHQMVVEWNDTRRDYPRDQCIHQLFEAQAERTPEAVAVVFEDQQLTYRELNAQANQLAHYLRKRGVGPEVSVGIYVERSVEMVVALLGTLKASGAYVPLDLAYPKERLAFMLADTQTQVLLTQKKLLGRLAEIQDPKSKIGNRVVVCLDSDWEIISRESTDNLASSVKADNLAYVIYTSGSTGKPKGAMIEHKSLVNYLCWVNESLLRHTVQTLPVVTRLTFDASLKQLFAPLLRGGEVWLLSDDIVTQPAALLQALGMRNKVGLNCVPSLWKTVLDAIDSTQAITPTDSLTCLFFGGEQFSKELVNRSFALLPHLEIWNLYGLTETTANASVARIVSQDHVTIGRPIANTQIYLLDRYFNPVPVGVLGELYIGGAGLARGYLKRCELTAEKFVPHPFSDEPGARLYKTGDLAYYRPDGNIQFLGRLDHQVKVRGFRIELGEIEAVLMEHPAVCETVVVVREDEPGEERLVAYVVANQEQVSTAGELRSFLKAKLPGYMVPSTFVQLDALPLTPNGKVDRRTLPTPDQAKPELEKAFEALRTPVEEALAGIWAEVLRVEQVGVHDNFFDLGGHSLLATQILSRVRDAFQVELPLRSLFEKPTIEGLAEVIEMILLEEIEDLSDDEAERLV
jgi:amino acid adenylation domain-containing protein